MMSPVKNLVSTIKYIRAMEKILAQSIKSEVECRMSEMQARERVTFLERTLLGLQNDLAQERTTRSQLQDSYDELNRRWHLIMARKERTMTREEIERKLGD
jgi:hypothetical protein